MSKTLTFEEYQKYLDTQDLLTEAFREYAKLVGIDDGDMYVLDGASDLVSVDFRWHETWGYGGEETHYQAMPSSFLYDRAAWQVEHEAKMTKEQKLHAENLKIENAKQEAWERAQLAELLKRYGTDTGEKK
jgi:hypothetical protein